MSGLRSLSVTSGDWMTVPCADPQHLNFLFIRQSDSNYTIAVVPPKDSQPNWHDAALLASSHLMLDTLIQIYEKVNNSKGVYSIDEINDLIGHAMEKIIVEADI